MTKEFIHLTDTERASVQLEALKRGLTPLEFMELHEQRIKEKNTKEEPDYNIYPCCGGLSSDPIVPVKERGKVTRIAGGYKIELTEDQKESLKADVSFIPGLKGKE